MVELCADFCVTESGLASAISGEERCLNDEVQRMTCLQVGAALIAYLAYRARVDIGRGLCFRGRRSLYYMLYRRFKDRCSATGRVDTKIACILAVRSTY